MKWWMKLMNWIGLREWEHRYHIMPPTQKYKKCVNIFICKKTEKLYASIGPRLANLAKLAGLEVS